MERFLPHYISADFQFPEEYDWKFHWFFDLLNFNIKYTEISDNPPNLDLRDTKIVFEDKFDMQSIKIDFPALKKWTISAMQDLGVFYLPNEKVSLIFENFDIKMNMVFGVNDQGYLLPKVYSAEVDFGQTRVEHDNGWVAFVSFYTVRLLMQVIKNSIYFVGPFILDKVLEPVLTDFLWNYDLFVWLESAFPGQNDWDYFDLDMRQTNAPRIHSGYMDIFMSGELYYRSQGC